MAVRVAQVHLTLCTQLLAVDSALAEALTGAVLALLLAVVAVLAVPALTLM
jgi:uncharacterized MnhB-related membrane protein